MEGCAPVKRALSTLSGDFGSGSAGRPVLLAFPAGVGVEGGGAESLEPGESPDRRAAAYRRQAVPIVMPRR